MAELVRPQPLRQLGYVGGGWPGTEIGKRASHLRLAGLSHLRQGLGWLPAVFSPVPRREGVTVLVQKTC